MNTEYHVLPAELSQIYKCKVKIIPYVMTWEGIATNFHRKHLSELAITARIEAYIQAKLLKSTLEGITLRQGLREDNPLDEAIKMLEGKAEIQPKAPVHHKGKTNK